MDEFEIEDSSLSIFDFDFFEKIKSFVKYVTLHILGMGPLILFSISIGAVFILGGYIVIQKIAQLYCDSKSKSQNDKKVDNPIPKMPNIIQSFLFEVFYVPILSSILPIFVCTYHCDYKAGTIVDPYPPLDVYTEVSCRSAGHIALFILGAFAILLYFPLASQYIVVDAYSDKPFVANSVRFQLFEQIMRV